MRKVKIAEQNNGFTLLEALIAMVILSIGIFSMYSMQVTAIRGNSRAMDLTYASTWAADKIEELTNMPYDDLLDTDSDGTDQDAANDGNGTDDDGDDFGLNHVTTLTADNFTQSPDGFYDIFWNVAINHPMNNLKTLRIHVKYSVHGEQKTVVMDYVKAKS